MDNKRIPQFRAEFTQFYLIEYAMINIKKISLDFFVKKIDCRLIRHGNEDREL